MKLIKQKLVGITGTIDEAEVRELLAIFKKHHINGSILVNGIMIDINAENFLRKHASKFVSPDKIKPLLVNDAKLFNVLHFVKSESDNFANAIDRIASGIEGEWHGIQLNIPWPKIEEMKILRKTGVVKRKSPFIILQVDAACFDKVSTSKRVANRVVEYDRYIDHLLIDVTHIKQAEDKQKFIERCIKDIKVYNPSFTIGVAGNLDGDSLLNLDKLIKHHKLSCDADDKLRCPITSRFDMKKCEDYIAAASLLYN